MNKNIQKKIGLKYAILILVLILISSSSLIFYANNKISKLETQLEEKNIEIGSLENQLQVANEEIKKLKVKEDNLTIAVMGDSLIFKSTWVQIFNELLETNYPYINFNVIPSARGGERAESGDKRFYNSVAIHNPDIVIIAYGTNDTGVTKLPNFRYYITMLAIRSRNLGAEVFINLIGPITTPGKEGYAKYNDEIIKISEIYPLKIIDILAPLSQNPEKYLIDDMHYNYEGSLVVANIVFEEVSKYLDKNNGNE